jgi:haloalkane dehalogenase
MATSKSLPKDVKNGFLFPYDNWKNRVAVWRFVRDIPYEPDHPSLPLLKKTEASLKKYLNTPVLSCWGMKDFCFHSGFLKEWEDIWPHMKVHRMEESGHYLLEDSFNACRLKIEPFLLG